MHCLKEHEKRVAGSRSSCVLLEKDANCMYWFNSLIESGTKRVLEIIDSALCNSLTRVCRLCVRASTALLFTFYTLMLCCCCFLQKIRQIHPGADPTVRHHVHRAFHRLPSASRGQRRVQRRLPVHRNGLQLFPGDVRRFRRSWLCHSDDHL